MEFTLGEEGSENIKKIKHNEKSGKIMDLRSMVWMKSIENKITRGGEFKGLEASELEESSMCKSYLKAQTQEIIPVSE